MVTIMAIALERENNNAGGIAAVSSVTNMLIKNKANAKNAPQINNTFDKGFKAFSAFFVVVCVSVSAATLIAFFFGFLKKIACTK